MPELPEVETVRRGVEPHVVGRTIQSVVVRDSRLRWPIPAEFAEFARGKKIRGVSRRGKYLVFDLGGDRLIVHLGMTGRLLLLDPETPLKKHDHVDLLLSGKLLLRFHDPRRFGAVLPWPVADAQHALLAEMGPEPLTEDFSGDHLFERSRGRSAAVKLFLMDNAIVVGVGNIYASEALFAAGIDPRREAGAVSRARYAKLAAEVKRILAWAIERGGTTLRDFLNPDGAPGYFYRELFVYGRAGQPCRVCGTEIRQAVLGQRSTFWCPRCQR